MNGNRAPLRTTAKELRIKLIKSLVTGFLFFSILFTLFLTITADNKEDETSFVLRKFQNINASIFSYLQSPDKLSLNARIPMKGTKVRFNGDEGLTSELDLANYKISVISGIKELILTLSEIQKLPSTEVSTEFRCIEGWSSDIHYKGLRFSDFMSAFHVGKKDDGKYYKFVALETPDAGYYVSIDMASMLHSQTVLAYEMNQAPLTLKNGAPLRLIIPIKYGVKSLKRIGRIYFSDERPRDYWTDQGYDWFSGL